MPLSDITYKDLYYVAVKLFLEKDGAFYVMKDKWGDGDLPGGRLRTYEFETQLEDVIRRKANEELGEHVIYELGKPIVMMRHGRVEQVTPKAMDNPTVRIFAVGYEATLTGGEPRLGDHHVEGRWVDIQTFNPEEYFSGGWLKGVQEYLALRRA